MKHRDVIIKSKVVSPVGGMYQRRMNDYKVFFVEIDGNPWKSHEQTKWVKHDIDLLLDFGHYNIFERIRTTYTVVDGTIVSHTTKIDDRAEHLALMAKRKCAKEAGLIPKEW